MTGGAGLPPPVAPMLASPSRGRLPDDPRFGYEYKYDGYRAVLRVSATGTMVLTSRNDKDITAEFDSVSAGLGDVLGGRAAVLDGELVVLNEVGQPEFRLMQERRGRYQQGLPVADLPVRYLVFDLLRLGDADLTGEPYHERRRLLAELGFDGPISVVPAFTHAGLAREGRTPRDLLGLAAEAGYEGLIAKRLASRYYPGRRSPEWLKHPLTQTQEVIVCGWRPGKGRRDGMVGGLLLGAHEGGGDLVYLGDVGTGFTERALRDLGDRLAALERHTSPFPSELSREDARQVRWVEPVLVGEVVYRQFTRGDRRLRHAAWRGLRPDREPGEITAPEPTLGRRPGGAEVVAGERVMVQVGERRLSLSNLDKELYPDGFSKGEVINYYSRIAPILLPHLAGRPVTFIRYPNGVAAEAFFEKNVPSHAPDWVRTVRLPSSGSRGGRGDHIDHVVLDDLPTLVWAANLAALELHVPQWTVDARGVRGTPDRLVFDLDPGPGTTVVECCRIAERLYDILTGDGLTPVAKTSGAKGMQLYAGIHTRDAERPSAYAKAVAERLAAETPDLAVAKMAKNLRRGKVFVDWSQNNPAKTTIAPYSLRGRDRPTVSTPVSWDEVRACRRPADLTFTADDVLDRAGELGDLFGVLARRRATLVG
ncbi:DNA ligase D [Actinophytocola sp.]|uniref:DNA ligase D n=1 Tax=Actinophytocola sp. TaxID=1872138 RepID=UPI003D6B7EF6